MSQTWGATVGASLAEAFARPAWWTLALAAFLVRGGVVIVALPLVSLPSAAGVANLFAPTINRLVLGDLSVATLAAAAILAATLAAALVLAWLAGAWLDLALLTETLASDDAAAGWQLQNASPWQALGLRLAAHVPTLLAIGYGLVRIIAETYAELLSPGNPAVPVAVRVLGRTPDAIAVVLVAWTVGEAAGGLAARRAAAGEPVWAALRGAAGALLHRRGVATLLLSGISLVAVVVPLAFALERTFAVLRVALSASVGPVEIVVALLVMVACWVLGLALLGIVLAWRQVAWTLETTLPPGSGDGGGLLAEGRDGILQPPHGVG